MKSKIQTLNVVTQFKQLLRENDLKWDPWGTAMSAWFDVASHLFEKGNCPREWQYKPGMGGNHIEEDSYYYEFLQVLDAEQLESIGKLLYRYCEILKLNGKDY